MARSHGSISHHLIQPLSGAQHSVRCSSGAAALRLLIQRLSIPTAHIAWAAEGGEILIVDNGKALARLVPPGEPAAYRAHPPTASEFSSDEDSLAWDADGWEDVA